MEPKRRKSAPRAKPRSSDPRKSSWGSHAQWYHSLLNESDDTYQKQVILPNITRLVHPQSSQKILDIGCGEGFFARAFAEQGAEVYGFDIGPELIAIAQKHKTPHTHFAVAPATDIKTMADNSCDAAVCILALQNIRDLNGAVREAHRIVRTGGSYYIVLNHPAFRIPQSSSWHWDEETHTLARRNDAYLTEREIPIIMHPGAEPHAKTYSYHRSLQLYIKTLVNTGFVITGMEEWISHKTSQPGARADAENTARKEFPLFLMIKATKLQG